MSLLIDGYNLMHAAGIIGRGVGTGSLERSRLAVLNFVVESIDPADIPTTTVVFDAQNAPPGLPRELDHRGIRVRFAAGFANADELIEDLIEQDSAPRRLTVVSSDHRLHRAARRRKAHAIDSDRWYAETIARRRDRQRSRRPEPSKPPTPLAVSEVEFWLAKFGPAEAKNKPLSKPPEKTSGEPPETPPGDDIFPQEYLDSIAEELDE